MFKVNRKAFFDAIRRSPFNGLVQSQVQGISSILDEWERRKLSDPRWLAYILATTKWETDHTMQPIKEAGSALYLRRKKYYPWIGRGYVQLTWERNYKKFQPEVLKLFGVDIVKVPDGAMEKDVAAYIMFEGMIRGDFTGKKLGDYFQNQMTDWYHARKIINGLDKATEISAIAKEFFADLIASGETT